MCTGAGQKNVCHVVDSKLASLAIFELIIAQSILSGVV